MEILIFLVGFLLGALVVFIYHRTMSKNIQKVNDLALENMKMFFENTANRIFKENSQELSAQNKEKLEEFYKNFKERIEDLCRIKGCWSAQVNDSVEKRISPLILE